MQVNGQHYRTIFLDENNEKIKIINQRSLPHEFNIVEISTCDEMCEVIRNMTLRGAGLIGAATGYGMYLAALEAEDKNFDEDIHKAAEKLKQTRPTAVNLAWAVERQLKAFLGKISVKEKRKLALQTAIAIANEDAEACKRIGEYGVEIIREIAAKKEGPVNILTHCNAGWLAFVDHGTALSPIYKAQAEGIDVHVWVDETRPRNQGASLTSWELAQQGVAHTLITDNAGGHLMQKGMVDMVITGADRVAANGDVANKIGTYLKALAAKDNGIPFYVALPSSTFDLNIKNGVRDIPIEERDANEVKYVSGKNANAQVEKVLICLENTSVGNWGFDVTPARLITKLICEKGICDANKEDITRLLPDEGYIKFKAEKRCEDLPEFQGFALLNLARTKLHDMKLIGMYSNGIGYGNISLRVGKDFLISGSATGNIHELPLDKYALVSKVDIARNTVYYSGKTTASSESMSHAMIYQTLPNVKCVIHVHHAELHQFMKREDYDATAPDVSYGTPEFAESIISLLRNKKESHGVFVTPGHEEGVFVYGESVDEAMEACLNIYTAIS